MESTTMMIPAQHDGLPNASATPDVYAVSEMCRDAYHYAQGEALGARAVADLLGDVLERVTLTPGPVAHELVPGLREAHRTARREAQRARAAVDRAFSQWANAIQECLTLHTG
jgi:predicted nucleic acid-binding Zn ribbon protein